MYCTQCRAELMENAAFCSECGARVQLPSDDGSSALPGYEPSHDGSANGNADCKHSWVIVALTAVVVVAAAAGLFAFSQHRAYEESHRAVSIPVSFVAEGYGDGAGSGVPLLVEGQDLDGQEVSETVVLPVEGGYMELRRGEYTVKPAGCFASDSGCLYLPTTSVMILDVGESGTIAADSATEMVFVYEPVPPDQVTDDQIQALRDWMSACGISSPDTDRIAGSVVSARQVEADRIAEEQRQAEEEARQRAEAERVARRDKLTGLFFGLGANAPGGLTSVTFGDGEVIVVGELSQLHGGESMGNKTWVFGVDENTEYGYSLYDGFHAQSRDEVADKWAIAHFVGITFELQDGVAVRIWTGA